MRTVFSRIAAALTFCIASAAPLWFRKGSVTPARQQQNHKYNPPLARQGAADDSEAFPP